MKILLVDHSKTMRSTIKGTLRQIEPTEFLEAGNAREALSLISDNPDIDLALIDWNLDITDGHGLVQRIRDTYKQMPIIMCTTETDKPQILKAVKAGVNNYLVKPFASEVLIEKVKATLKKAKETSEGQLPPPAVICESPAITPSSC